MFLTTTPYYGSFGAFSPHDLGAPWITNYDRLTMWGTVEHWNPRHRWGRVVVRGTSLLHWAQDLSARAAKVPGAQDWHQVFSPTLFVGNTVQYYNAGAAQSHKFLNTGADTHLGYDPHMKNDYQEYVHGADTAAWDSFTGAQCRALKELKCHIRCQLRAEDICENRVLDWDRCIDLKGHLVAFDLIKSSERFEARCARLLYVEDLPAVRPADEREEHLAAVLPRVELVSPRLTRCHQGDFESKHPDTPTLGAFYSKMHKKKDRCRR